jgi:two-component system response regulator HupR/HoxA
MSETTTVFDQILGSSPAAQAIRDFGRRAARVDAAVLLTGESGTGKGLLARAIHHASRRSRGAFVAVNCAGLPESLFESEFFGHSRGAFTGAQQAHRGLLEQAHAGTLFLDEIGELALPLQAKLLTAVEEGEFRRLGGERVIHVEARLIAATSVDLERAVSARAFRRDLYHRLLVLAFRLPALRERHGDIDLFLADALERFAARYGRQRLRLDPAAHARLRAHPWPGNIRQLVHAVEAAVLASDTDHIELHHLASHLTTSEAASANPGRAPEHTLPRVRYSFYGTAAEERRHIQEVLRRCHGNKTRAAAELGMARNTLRGKLREEETLAPSGLERIFTAESAEAAEYERQ